MQQISNVSSIEDGPLHQLACLPPPRLHALTPQQHHQQLMPLPFQGAGKGGGKARACVGSDSCFDATPSFPQHLVGVLPRQLQPVSRLFLNKRVRFHSFNIALVLALHPVCESTSLHNSPKVKVSHGGSAELGEVCGCGVVVGVGESVRVGEVAVGHVQFPCESVHLPEEGGDKLFGVRCDLPVDSGVEVLQESSCASLLHLQQKSADFSDEMGSVVSTGKHHSKIKFVQRVLSIGSELSSSPCELAGRVGGANFQFLGVDADGVDNFQNRCEIHNFGQTRHFSFLVGPVSPKRPPLLHVVNQPTFCTNSRRHLAQCNCLSTLLRVSSHLPTLTKDRPRLP